MGFPLQGSGFGGGGGDANNLGYFADPVALQTAYPTASAGNYAIVGSTNTIWIWDVDTVAWINSGTSGQVTSIVTTGGGTETGSVTINATKIEAVPITRTVNGKALNANITLEKDDIDATIIDSTDLAAALTSYVPTSRTINGQPLTSNVTITIPDELADLTSDSTHRTVTDAEKSTWNGKQDALGYTPENLANKGVANGYAPLDATNKVPSTYIGQIAVTHVVVATVTPSNPEEGWVWVNPEDGSYIYDADTLSWATLSNPTGYVETVNSYSGPNVTLTKSDIGLGNVTNNNQVIATGGRTAGNLVTFSLADGTTLGDGYGVVTTISESATDSNIPTEKAVRDAINNITIILDSEVASTSTNGVENQAIWYNLEGGSGHPGKVDKEVGKGLSTNDYTTTEKNKLAGIAAGAEVNVQSDWSVVDTGSDAYILNKPGNPTETASGLVPPVTGTDVNKYLHAKADGTGLEWATVSGGSGASEAVNVSYDPATSGLTATNVQAAIDELDEEKLGTALPQGYSFVGNSEGVATIMQVATLPTWTPNKYIHSTAIEGVLEFVDVTGGSELTFASGETEVTLPGTPSNGQIYEYVGTGDVWTITANTGQTIRLLGYTGNTLIAEHPYACVGLVFLDNVWIVRTQVGTLDLSTV